MLTVRTLAEAEIYARATGFAVTRRSSEAGLHLWQGWFRDTPREERFAVVPTTAPVLDAEDFAEVAAELIRSVPPPMALPRRAALRVVEDLTLALYALDEAGTLADAEARALAVSLRSAWMRTIPPDAPPGSPVPDLLEVQRARLRATLLPGLPVAEGLRRLLAPGESATLVTDEECQLRALDLRDPEPRRAALLIFTEAGRISGHRAIEGADGRALLPGPR